MLRLASVILIGQVGLGTSQFGGFVIPPGILPTSFPMPSIPTGPSALADIVTDVLAGSPLPGIPTGIPPLPAVPTEWKEMFDNILAGSPLPPALPSDQNGPWMAMLNGSALPAGLVPTELSDMLSHILHGSAVPEGLSGFQEGAQAVMEGSALPTRRMPTLPVIPGMPSIDMAPYQGVFEELFDSMKDMFSGIEFMPADILKELAAQGFSIPSIDPQALMTNRDDYLSKIRDQLQHLIEKVREKGLVDRFNDLRTNLNDIIEGKKQFNIADAETYLEQVGGLVGDRLNSTVQGALRNISILDVHDSLRRIGSLVAGSGNRFEKMTSDFGFVADKLRDGVENIVRFNYSAVGLPPLPLLNQTLTLIQWEGNPFAGVLTSRGVNSSVISVMLADAFSGNETVVRDLEQLINITLPLIGGSAGGSVPECVYWNTTVSDWLSNGCYLQKVLNGSVVCGCNHLTDFAVVLVGAGVVSSETATPSPGPRPSSGGFLVANIELTSSEEGKDIKPLIGGIVGGVAGSLILSIVAANLWDRRKKARRARKALAATAPMILNPTTIVVKSVV